MRYDYIVNMDDSEDVAKYVDYLKNLRGIHIVHHQEVNEQRSSDINRYYWGAIVHYVSEYTGYTKIETHELIKNVFMPHVVFTNQLDLLSTTNCNNEEMWELCEMVKDVFNRLYHVRADAGNLLFRIQQCLFGQTMS